MSKTTVKERPILFSGPMVRAIFEGRKTQTRRIVKIKPGSLLDYELVFDGKDAPDYCPYGKVGDHLWVRESWCEFPNPDGRKPGDPACMYQATSSPRSLWRWKPSIHMPRWASRITLEITGVRVERLNDISHHDALQEGLIEWSDPPRVSTLHYGLTVGDCFETTAKGAFKRLWKSINGEFSWDANPWVWVIEFKRIGQ